MNTVYIVVTIGSELLTLIISAVIATFAAGNRWGKVESKMDFISDRLAKIEGMFVLRIKDTDHDSKGLSVGVVFLDCMVLFLGILGHRDQTAAIYSVGLCMASGGD